MSSDHVRRFALQFKGIFTKYCHSLLNALILYHDFKNSKASRTSIYVVTCEGTVDSHFHVFIILEMIYFIIIILYTALAQCGHF
jgi:hypothetical protein